MNKIRQKLITEKVEFKKNNTVRVDIPQDNPIRQLVLNVKLKLTTGATAGTTAKHGDILNAIKRIQILRDNTDVLKDLNPRAVFDVYPFQTSGVRPHKDTLAIPAAGTSKTMQFLIPIDFAVQRRNLLDLSAIINAPSFGSLQLSVQWGDIGDVIGVANNTIIDEDTEITITMSEVYDDGDGENTLNNVVAGAIDLREGWTDWQYDRAYSEFPNDALEIKVLPIPAVFFDTTFMALDNITDSNPALSSDNLKELLIENVKGGGEKLAYLDLDTLIKSHRFEYGLDHAVEGVYFRNWLDERGASGFVNVDVDALKYRFKTAAPAANKNDAIRIVSRYVPAQRG